MASMSQPQVWFRRAPGAPAANTSRGQRARAPYERELHLAAELARAAGRAALHHYGVATAILKVGGSPVTVADREASRIILQGLRRHFPADAVLSEEEEGVAGQARARRLWLVDPLDGTKEFLAQNGEFSVMIGLAERGRSVLGVVYAPALDVLWGAAPGLGAFVERDGVRRPLVRRPVAAASPVRLVGSRSHADPLVLALARQLGGAAIAPSGSVGLKCARIAEGLSEAYVHPIPYMKAWDLCAPEAILREAGGTVTDCLGEALRYRRTQPEQPHGIVACAPGVTPAVMAALAPLYAERAAALAASKAGVARAAAADLVAPHATAAESPRP